LFVVCFPFVHVDLFFPKPFFFFYTPTFGLRIIFFWQTKRFLVAREFAFVVCLDSCLRAWSFVGFVPFFFSALPFRNRPGRLAVVVTGWALFFFFFFSLSSEAGSSLGCFFSSISSLAGLSPVLLGKSPPSFLPGLPFFAVLWYFPFFPYPFFFSFVWCP